MDFHVHNYIDEDDKIKKNEKKTLFVVILTLITMIVEVSYGYITGSMALLADGWHMGSHVGALGISLIAYRMARSQKVNSRLNFGAGKLMPLGGYTSALLLGAVAFVMGIESFERFLNPTEINFSTAIVVSIIGLVVNLLSAALLWNSHDHHHHHDHGHEHHHHHDHGDHVHDHNHQSALLHVIADALTSVLAIAALLMGKYWNIYWADPIIGILGGVVILKWAWGLLKVTVWELLDGHSTLINQDKLKDFIEENTKDHGGRVVDLHVWRIAPGAHAFELIIESTTLKGSDHYRELISHEFDIQHLVIEERLKS